MSDPSLNLPIKSAFDPTGTDAALRALRQLQAEQAKAQPRGDGSAAKAFKASGDAALAAERDTLRYAQALASAQRATGDLAGASQTWATALKQVTPNTVEAHRATAGLAQAQKALQRDLAGGRSVGQEFTASLKSGLLGVVGPAAAATAAIGTVVAVGQSFKDAFKFQAELDATRASINAQLTGVRNLGQVYTQAAGFADEFKLTQKETTEAVQASIGVMRASKAPVEDILSVLARMQVLSPEQSLQEAAIALKALASGDTTSLVTRFEVGRDVANEMKQEIAGGADAVQVMNKFLLDSGVGMEALKAKTEGASGAMKDLARAQEAVTLAQGRIATSGTGVGFVGAYADGLKIVADTLTGDLTAAIDAASNNLVTGFGGSLALSGQMVNQFAGGLFGLGDASMRAGADLIVAGQASRYQGDEAQIAAQKTEIGATAYDAAAAAALSYATGADQVTSALGIQTEETLLAAIESAKLEQFQTALANLGSAVAAGHMSAADAAAFLTSNYNRAAGEAARLIALQAQVARAQNTAMFGQATKPIGAQGSGVGAFLADQEAAAAEKVKGVFAGLASSASKYEVTRTNVARAGGGARANVAEQTATKLADIERQGGNKIAEINEQTQAKLAAIDEKYAEQRAAAHRRLMDEIARANASTAFAQQLNDFDQFAKDLSDEQKAALADREKAEADYNAKVAGYQEEARQQAATGDAELAEDILAARTEQAKKEQEIAEKAAEARRAGGNAAAVAREAQEATDAARAQAETEIAIAQAKAAERAGAQQAEKDAVVATANEQKEKVIAAAEEQASRVKGASADQKSAVLSSLRAQADAANAWADTMVDAARRAQGAMGGVNGPPAPPTGEGGTEGGEAAGAPGGQGLAGMRAAGGGGGGSVASAIQTLNDAAEIIKVIKPFVAANKGAVKLLNEYSLTVKSAVGSLLAIEELRRRLSAPQPVLDPAQVERLKADIEYVLKTMVAVDVSATNKVRVLAKYLELEKSAVEILTMALDLRNALAAPTPPIDRAYALQLFQETAVVSRDILNAMPPMVQKEIDNLKAYRDGSGAAIAIINDAADLASTLAEPRPAVPHGSIRKIAELTAQTTRVILALLVPLTQAEGAALTLYKDSALAAVEVVTAAAELPELLAEPRPAIPFGSIKKLAEIALQVLRVVNAVMQPTAEETRDGLERYTASASAAIGLITEAAELPDLLAKARPAVAEGSIRAIAADAKRITQIVLSEMVPVGEAQADAAQRYADAAGSSIGVIKDTLGLHANLFADYTSPTDAQINLLARDSIRIVDGIARAAATMDTKGLEAAKAFGEANSAILASFKEQMSFALALRSDDFLLDKKQLALFEQAGVQIIGVAGRLGALAATVPAGNLAALNGISDTIMKQSDMWLKMASVPFGDLSGLSRSAGAQGGGAGGMTVNLTINTQPGQNARQIAEYAIQLLNQRVSGRRAS